MTVLEDRPRTALPVVDVQRGAVDQADAVVGGVAALVERTRLQADVLATPDAGPARATADVLAGPDAVR